MSSTRAAIFFAFGVVALTGAGYWYAGQSGFVPPLGTANAASPHSHGAPSERPVLYYRDPSGAANWSATPRKDAAGRDFLPVYDDEETSFEPAKKASAQPAWQGERKILYYRNPMGLPDNSPVPKKDAMGMDYIPVYSGEEPEDGAGIKISLGRVQRAGVRTEPVEARVLVQPVRAVGTIAVDERRLTIVSLRAESYIEDLFVNTTGQQVKKGEPLFRIYSSQIQSAQTDFLVALGASNNRIPGIEPENNLKGGMQRLRNLDVPESRIEEIRKSRENPRTLDWPSPADGTILSKKVIKGQRVMPGDELYRIADLSTVWIIADVAERDLALLHIGTRAKVTLRAYPNDPVEGEVTLIYPELKTETRTARVRIEVANPDLRLKTDMYADVEFRTGAGDAPVAAVPDSAVIDDGKQQIVLVSKEEGRFEPRPVKLGRRGEGYREVVSGVNEGELIVTSANFLIDAESNLRSALKTFQPEATQ
jgi:membrane fusion protein, copper/silver efflux system